MLTLPPTYANTYIYSRNSSALIKKVRPPNTLQCDSRFNETLMEMSSRSLPHCSPEEQEKRSVWFLMSLRARGCQCICSGGRVSQRISQISASSCKDSSFIPVQRKAEEAHVRLIIHETRESQVTQLHAGSLQLIIKHFHHTRTLCFFVGRV